MNASVLSIVVFVAIIAYLIAAGVFARRLRANHYALWQQHGEFLMVENNTPRGGLQMFRFMWSKIPARLGDRPLWFLALTTRIFFVLVAILLVLHVVYV